MKQQLILGDFVFSLGQKTAYEGLTLRSGGGWVNIDIINNKPLSHNTGLPLHSLKLNGRYFGTDGMVSLARLRQLQESRRPQVLMDGLGKNLGRWKIMEITETQKRIIDDGTALVIDFTLDLEEYVDAAN